VLDGRVTTYFVLYGPNREPTRRRVRSLVAATRLAVSFMREERDNVRVTLPGGATLTFKAFQDAVICGALRD
jgi:hypothetical protein